MSSQTQYASLEEQFQRIAKIDHALTFLQWDQLVMMPPGGHSCRAEAVAELSAMRHEMLCSPRIGDQLKEALQNCSDTEQTKSLHEMERVYERASCIPTQLVKAQSLAGSICEQGWRQHYKENDWASFLKNFKKVVELSREEARIRQEQDKEKFPTPYDALLDLYCTGDSSFFIENIFSQLKEKLPQILAKARQDRKIKEVDLKGAYPIESQIALNRKLMEILGFDFDKGRLDVSMHPFSTGGRGDQRITTRFRQTDFLEALLATAHETGHASYENGLPAKWDGLPVGQARNMCIHESQSLLFEKQLFLSPPFFTFFTDILHEHLPLTQKWDAGQLWDAATEVKPGLIRVEADEVTYPMHIILRFEIEKSLINSTIQPEDVPEIWDSKMMEYLGLSTAGNYTEGCLQDIHWTDGSFGYFPSYTLGALNAAQIFTAIQNEHQDWTETMGRGEIGFVHRWLKEKIWNRASFLDSQELISLATGSPTDPACFLAHLEKRYG
ncbi:MAG: carboxypeptidase M32 [Desulfopila sp.]|jgi:carboxypeptidase Taq|nr:carboxypeptidase M32 [Desulfopila sp.]